GRSARDDPSPFSPLPFPVSLFPSPLLPSLLSSPLIHPAATTRCTHRLRYDPRLLQRLRGRISLRRRGALRTASVAQRDSLGKQLAQARFHVAPRPHVARLFLCPHDLAQ